MRRRAILGAVPGLCLAPRLARGAADARIALVIGNADYAFGPDLVNPLSDARAIGNALHGLGFRVFKAENLSMQDFSAVLSAFQSRIEGARLVVVYYAGHGVQIDGTTFLLPTDNLMDRPEDLATALMLNEVLDMLRQDLRAAVVLVDSCRDNPFYQRRTRGIGAARGQGEMDGPSLGMFVGYASQPGAVAYDGANGHSPFASALLEALKVPGLDIDAILRRVRRAVIDATGGKQVPWSQSSLLGEVVLHRRRAVLEEVTGPVASGTPQSRRALIEALCARIDGPAPGCSR